MDTSWTNLVIDIGKSDYLLIMNVLAKFLLLIFVLKVTHSLHHLMIVKII
jgi:hypothetical protein